MQQPSEDSMDVDVNHDRIDMSQKSSQFKRFQRNVVKTSYPLHTQQLMFYCLSPSVAFAKDLKLARSYVFFSRLNQIELNFSII
jgi:hypothetical protein